jgi:hypothetical protein
MTRAATPYRDSIMCESMDKETDPETPSEAVLLDPSMPTVQGPEGQEVGYLIGQDVVLDTRGELLYIGRLEAIGQYFYVLKDADVHDLVSGRTSKEIYILETFKYGIKKNRRSVHVRSNEILSLSALKDIVDY